MDKLFGVVEIIDWVVVLVVFGVVDFIVVDLSFVLVSFGVLVKMFDDCM